MYQSCELVLFKGEELYLFLINLIVYGDVTHDVLTMVDMAHIESSFSFPCSTTSGFNSGILYLHTGANSVPSTCSIVQWNLCKGDTL